MQRFENLPGVLYHGSNGKGTQEFEAEGVISNPASSEEDEVVFVGEMGDCVYISIGKIVFHKVISAEESISKKSFTRFNIDGICVTFNI